jgi:hypothetical protein
MKESKELNLLLNAIKLEMNEPKAKWTIKKLAENSKTSRGYIYQKFDGNKQRILMQAVEVLGRYIAGVDQESFDAWDEGNLPSILREKREFIKAHPYLFEFYIINRTKDGEIGKRIRELEYQAQSKIESMYLGDNVEAKFIGLLNFSLIFHPFLDFKFENFINMDHMLRKVSRSIA